MEQPQLFPRLSSTS